MSFEHANKMHLELGEQGIVGGDCFATSLDSLLQGVDLADGFYYDIVTARNAGDEGRFERLIRRQLTKHFREDHPTFSTISSLSVTCAPDGNPLTWGAPSDQYEGVPPEFIPLIRELPKKEWERVYSIEFDDETEEERQERAESARQGAYGRLGIFVVAHNLIMDGVSLMPLQMQTADISHVFAVAHNGLNDLHVIDAVMSFDADEDAYRPIERSPHLPLAWLCEVDPNMDTMSYPLNSAGEPFTPITSSMIPIGDSTEWKYALHPVPPQK